MLDKEWFSWKIPEAIRRGSTIVLSRNRVARGKIVTSRALIGVCLAGGLLFAACGSSSKSGSGATTTIKAAAGATTTAAGTPTSSGAAPTTAAPQKADPSKSEVLIGYHNLEDGQISLPEIRLGFDSGINYVNEELGGINGHPVKVDYCHLDVTPESSVNCANQFVEKNVVLAVQGVDVAADAALPILKQAGIAEVGFFAFSPAMNKAKGDAFFTLFANEDNYAGDLYTQQKLGAKSEAVVMADLPTSHSLDTDVIQPTAKKLGMTATAYYYPTTTDWTTFAATVLAKSPDAVSFPAAEDTVCLAAIPALRGAGFTGYIHASSCSEIIDKLDAKTLDKVINHNEFYYPTMTSIPAKAQQDLNTFMKYIKRDHPDFKSYVYTQLGFHIAVQAADMMRQVTGDLTAQNIKAKLPTTSGESFFRDAGDRYDCSKGNWPGTTACSSSEFFTKVTADKKKELLPNQPPDLSSVRPAG
ncbi:MAG: branched-chain amino acid transport system substrate-binding protein [Acidimicrobiaceae bacterium]|nr:branched-chain amino acid transport system substrate-binding protein [Acidimicrobiaceae bacterium]